MKPEAFEDKFPKSKDLAQDLSIEELEKKLSLFESKIEDELRSSKSLPKTSAAEKESPVLAELKKRLDQVEGFLKKEQETVSSQNSSEVENKLQELEAQIQSLHIDFLKALAREPKPLAPRAAASAAPQPQPAKKSAALSIFQGLIAGFFVAAFVWGASLIFPAFQPWVSEAAAQIRIFFHQTNPGDVSPVPPGSLEDFKIHEREFKLINALLYYMENDNNPKVRAKSAQLLKGWAWKGVPEHLLMAARQDSNPEVTRNAFASFAAITGYRGDKNSEAAEKWWQENSAAVNIKLAG